MSIATISSRSRCYWLLLLLVFCTPTALLAQGSWTAKSNVGFTPRWNYAAAADPANGKIYTFGGRMFTGSTNIFYNMIEVYDVETDTWSSVQYTGTMAKRMWHNASLVNGKFYLIGGFETDFGNTSTLIEEFDPIARTVKPVTPTGTVVALYGKTGTAVSGKKIYIFGGFNMANAGGVNTDVNIFDPLANTWQTITPTGDALIGLRTDPAATALGDDIYVTGGLGGETGYETFDVNQKFSVSSGSVSTVDPMITPLHSHSTMLIEGKLYFVGGQVDISGGANSYTFFYDPTVAVDKYETLFLSGERDDNVMGSAVAIGNTIYHIGYATKFDTITTQALTLDVATVKPVTEDTEFDISITGRQFTARSPRVLDAIEIYSVTGQSVAKSESPSQYVSLNLSFLPAGLYLVQARTVDGMKTAKFILE